MSVLKHYGTPRHSGRYPWGSGEDPYQRGTSWIGQVEQLRKQGLSDLEIAKGMGMNSSQFRARITLARAEKRQADYAMAVRLKEKGMSNVAIAERMGYPNESSIRSLLDPAKLERSEITANISNLLKERVDQYDYIDVGSGAEAYIGISRTKLKASLAALKEEGYEIHDIYIPQVTDPKNKNTTVQVLTKPGTTDKELYDNMDHIKTTIDVYSEDGGRSLLGLEPIKQVSLNRIDVAYESSKDGVIEVRRGVQDLALGDARYAQARIGVEGGNFLKGMVMYADDLPDGVDIRFNTNKKDTGNKTDAMKPTKEDIDNPFGATVRQRHYVDSNGVKQLSAINIVGTEGKINEEGRWAEWTKSLSSQFLSKQDPSLAKKQLGLAYDIKKEEYDEIMSLTNPVVKRQLLISFADKCDSDAVDLNAAAMPRQMTSVILPFPKMKDNEVYAPNFNNGERVVLIRYPHAGVFEAPELIVNNKYPAARKTIPNALDAIGINAKVAKQLSGADFDGDTVIVIPNKNRSIRTSSSLKDLENFDHQTMYALPSTAPKMKPATKEMQMGIVSNLITDMTIMGATEDEIVRAVRHSMVVIDAEKHHLNYKQSYIDNDIANLQLKYQGRKGGGASTVVSRAGAPVYLPHRVQGAFVGPISSKTGAPTKQYIDPVTGKKIYSNTGKTRLSPLKDKSTGEIIDWVEKPVKIKSSRMAETDDARTLSSGTPIEAIYAAHANGLKALANQARRDSLQIENRPYSPAAKRTYASEVASLESKLNVALKNAPLERQAQLFANKTVSTKRQQNPGMQLEELKKIRTQAIAEARARVGAGKQSINLTEREWEAIQSGAVSTNTLSKIIANTKPERIRALATPRTTLTMTPAKIARAESMLARGFTQAEVAEQMGISVTTLSKALKG